MYNVHSTMPQTKTPIMTVSRTIRQHHRHRNRWTANSDEIWLNLRRACAGSKPDTLLPVFWQLIVLTVHRIVLREAVVNLLNTYHNIVKKTCPDEFGSEYIMKIHSTRVETWSSAAWGNWGVCNSSVIVKFHFWHLRFHSIILSRLYIQAPELLE